MAKPIRSDSRLFSRCADPQAILVANAAWDAVERVGLPECRLSLSHANCYLATAPKSNSATVAIGLATKDVKEGRTLPVPKHHGEGAWVDQEYVPSDATYYTPSDWGFEAVIRERMAEIERRRAEGRMESGEALSEPDA